MIETNNNDEQGTSNLKDRAARATIWDMAGVLSKQGVAFLISIVLARLLSPEDFGLVAMALVFITISQTVADFGLASALIQQKDTSSLTYSSVFFFNLAVGLLLFAGFWFAAEPIAAFYVNDAIAPMIRWLSLSFIFNALSQVQLAILRKQIDFKKIAFRATAAQAISGVAGIAMAYSGFGVYALIAQNLLGAAISTVLLWSVSSWHPRWEFSWNEMRRLSGFSVYVFLAYVTGKVTTQIDTLVVGKLFNTATLGFYSRAASLNSLVTTFSSSSISKVAFSLLSHLQEDKERFIRTYFIFLEVVAFVSFGLSGFLVLAGSDIITVLFGAKWTPAIFIFQVLVLKSFTYPVNLLINSVFWAGGKSKESFWFGNIAKIVALAPLLVAMFWGFNPFLYALVVAAIVNWGLSNWFVTISFGISFLQQCKRIAAYGGLFLVIGLPLFALLRNQLQHFAFYGTILGLGFVAIYLVLNIILKTEGYRYVREQLAQLRKLAFRSKTNS